MNTVEYQIMFCPWYSYRILYPPTLRRGHPRTNFPEYAMADAYRRMQFYNNTQSTPTPTDLTSPYLRIPDYDAVIQLHGNNVHDLYSNLHLYRPVSQWAANKSWWAHVLQ